MSPRRLKVYAWYLANSKRILLRKVLLNENNDDEYSLLLRRALGPPCPKPILFAQGSQDGDRFVRVEDI